MGSLTIEPVVKTDQLRVIATLVSAFIADPVERWLHPQSLAYLTHFPAFVGAFGGGAFENKTVWSLDDFAAVAMWLPPGVEADGDPIVAALTQLVSAQKHADTFAILDQLDAAHPKDPHRYLPWLGVDCARQRPGLLGAPSRACRSARESSPRSLSQRQSSNGAAMGVRRNDRRATARPSAAIGTAYTVKSHLRSIYRKVAGSKRADAIRRTNQLDLATPGSGSRQVGRFSATD